MVLSIVEMEGAYISIYGDHGQVSKGGGGGGAGEEMRARAPGSTQHQQPPKGAKTVPKGRKCGQLEQDQVIKLRTKAKPVNRIDKLSLAHTLLERLDEFF